MMYIYKIYCYCNINMCNINIITPYISVTYMTKQKEVHCIRCPIIANLHREILEILLSIVSTYMWVLGSNLPAGRNTTFSVSVYIYVPIDHYICRYASPPCVLCHALLWNTFDQLYIFPALDISGSSVTDVNVQFTSSTTFAVFLLSAPGADGRIAHHHTDHSACLSLSLNPHIYRTRKLPSSTQLEP